MSDDSAESTSSSTGPEREKSPLRVALEQALHPIDLVRHHLPTGGSYNHTYGIAAEEGIRRIIRNYLPSSLEVTSGFVRGPGGDILLPGEDGDVSGQTDIIIYDATHSTPLFQFQGIDVVHARDVLGVVEVKDTGKKNDPLGPDGAIRQLGNIAEYASPAFRAVVLVQGDDPEAATSKLRDELDKLDSQPARYEFDRYCTVPNVIYGMGLSEKSNTSGYFGFYDYLEGDFKILRRSNEEIFALALFLRTLTGYMAIEKRLSHTVPTMLPPDDDDSIDQLDSFSVRDEYSSLLDWLVDMREKEEHEGASVQDIVKGELPEDRSLHSGTVLTMDSDECCPAAASVVMMKGRGEDSDAFASGYLPDKEGGFEVEEAKGRPSRYRQPFFLDEHPENYYRRETGRRLESLPEEEKGDPERKEG